MKRFLCGFLSCVILLTCFPSVSFAKNQDDPWSVHAQEYYGRTALSVLSNADALLFAYDQIAAGVEETAESINVYNGIKYISRTELTMVMDAYRRDYVQHFWVGNSYSFSRFDDSRILSVLPTYLMTGDELAAARAKFEASVNEILSGISTSMGEYDKELYIHDRLAERITYTSGTANAHNAYGAIVEGQCVCEGYAEAFQYLLEREGIHSFIVLGDGYSGGSWGGHAWNYVRIDGKYYHVDLTWNDAGDGGYHGYFNITDSMILEDHRIDQASYLLPECTSMDANYHVVNGSMFDSGSADRIAALLKKNNYTATVYYTGNSDDFISWYMSNYRAIASAAGITGGFSYGYSVSGKEFKLRLKPSSVGTPVAFVLKEQEAYWLDSVSSAIEMADGGYVKLLADSAETLVVYEDLYLDLNGFDLTGSVTVAEGATLYGMDSVTNDYNCSDDYGKIINLNGNYAIHHKTDITGMNLRYLAVEKDGAVSFHRFFVGVVYMSLQPSVTGVGYKAIFAGDQMLVDMLDEKEAFGFELALQNNASVKVFKEKGSFISGRNVTLRIDNFDVENYGETKLYAKALLKLSDGTVIESVQAQMTMRGMLEKLDKTLSIINEDQLAALKILLKEHPVISSWDTKNLYK